MITSQSVLACPRKLVLTDLWTSGMIPDAQTARRGWAFPVRTCVTMPTAPPRVCNRCKKPAPKGQPCQCRPAYEGSTHPGGHDDRRMARSMHHYRITHPRCEWPGCIRLADQVDHIVPLAEGGDRYDWSNYQSLCIDHHKTKTVADAQRGKTRAR